MQIIRDPAATASIADLELRALVEKTIADLSEEYPYDPDVLGYFLIVEPGDSLQAINAQIGASTFSATAGPASASINLATRNRSNAWMNTPGGTRWCSSSATTVTASRCGFRRPKASIPTCSRCAKRSLSPQ